MTDLWPLTFAARRSMLATFEQLDDDQFDTASLCDGWRVRDVLAHLILAHRPSTGRFLKAMARARGNFDRANDTLARELGQRPVDELVAEYRTVIDHRFSPPGYPQGAPLTDIVMHSFDVRIPLGLDPDVPADTMEPAAEMLLGRLGWIINGRGRPTVRWVANDHDWSHGDGPEVSGTMTDLTLAAGGRTARLDQLDGDGAAAVRNWLMTT